MPRVSIIMPSYNKAPYIAKSIESILNQTYEDWELIIIDDISMDESVQIIQSYKDERIIFRLNEENVGIAENRNRAIDIARGDYIALLDADDISTDFRLANEVEFLDNHADIDVVFGGFQEIDEHDNVKETYFTPLKNPAYIKAMLMVRNVVPNGSAMFRKDFVDKYNIRYRDGYLGIEDYLFWVECSLHGKISGLSDLFLYWRNTDNNGTNTYRYSAKYSDERVKKYSEILKYALTENGFELTDKDLELYFKFFDENKYELGNREEVECMYFLLKKLCIQAKVMENSNEIIRMYKKQFGVSLEKSFLWNF